METLIWLFGRGASVACGLGWTVPGAWASLSRDGLIAQIRKTLLAEMDSPSVDTSPYRKLLAVLGRRTAPGWRHRLVTTNWDHLLQREVNRACPTDCPPWLESTHVFHLNGTVEDLPDNSRRSCFLLESDPTAARIAKLESNLSFTAMAWSNSFVVVGMSFECATDNSLLTALGNAPLPVESSRWLVVNPNKSALDTVCANIRSKLPGTAVVRVSSGFAEWLGHGLPQLRDLGMLSDES